MRGNLCHIKALPSIGVMSQEGPICGGPESGQSFSPIHVVEQKRWVVRLVQAGLEVGRLRLEGQGMRKLTTGELTKFSLRGKPCSLGEGAEGLEEEYFEGLEIEGCMLWERES